MKKSANVVFPALLLILFGAAFLLYRWHSGVVVASAQSSSGTSFPGTDLRCTIREYPRSGVPLSGDGHFYSCEVRWRQVLLAASAYGWDSYTAKQCSVEITSPTAAVFTIGDYRIRCSDIGWEGATWHRPE